MADFKVVGKLVVDDKGQLSILGTKAKKASKELSNTGKSARTADRNLKGAAQASSNTSKNFSKMAQGIEGGLVPAYATLAASLFAITAVFQGLKAAADLKNQQRGLEEFSAVTGQNMIGVAMSIRQATENIIGFKEAAQAAAITTAAGFSADQVKELAEGAKLASVALGRDLNDSFNRLVRGVTKAEPELLDELGIILRLDIATRKFADANGLVADKLTIAQRQAAVFAEVSGQLQEKFGDFSGIADDLVNPFAKLETAFMNVIKQLSEFIGPLEVVAEFLARNAGATGLVFAGFVTSIAKQAFPALTNLTEAFSNYGNNAQLRADQATAALKKHTTQFTISRQEFAGAELKKTAIFKKFLKQRGIDQAVFDAKTIANQKRSVAMMIVQLEKKAAAGKAINEAELAQLKRVHAQMVASHGNMTQRMIAGTQAAGAAIQAGIVLPAVAAQTALARLGTFVATRLGPVFAALGATINAAFFIFTAGFLIKFLADTLFFTEEYKKKQAELNEQFDITQQALDHITKTTEKTLKNAASEGTQSFKEMNKELLRTINLLTSVATKKALIDTLTGQGKTLDDPLGNRNTARVLGTQAAGVITTGLGADREGTLQRLRGLQASLAKPRQGIAASNASLRLDADIKAFEEGSLAVEEFAKKLQTLFFEIGKHHKFTGRQFLALLDPFINFNTELEESVSKHKSLMDASKALGETLQQTSRKFRPSATDTLGMGFQKVLDTAFKPDESGKSKFVTMGNESQEDAAIRILSQLQADGVLDASKFGLISREEKGPSGELKLVQELNMEKAKSLMLTIEEGVAAVNNVRNLSLQTQIAKDNVSLLSKRKDAASRLAAEQAKIGVFLAEQAEIENKIAISKLEQVGLEGGAAERKQAEIDMENQKLAVIIAQREEYQRSISIVGRLNDTFAVGLEKMFNDLAMGASSFTDVFTNMTKTILAEMAKIAAARMAANILSFIPFAEGGIIPMASGGIINAANSYGRGGIATEPTFLVGEGKHNEAVVPLPNGRSIPVEMNGSGGTNVTINVDGASTASGGGIDAETGKQLGNMIQAATMEIIQREKRPGGVLSR